MLARLLRTLLLVQLLVGALLGWLIVRPSGASWGLVAIPALLLPLTTVLLVVLASAFLSRAPGANLLSWRSLLGETGATALMFLWHLPRAKPAGALVVPTPVTPAAPHAGKPLVPVLLVHGYMCSRHVWDAMTRSLVAAGHPVMGLTLEPLFVSIDSYAASIEQAVTELCRETGATKVALIGHSMGGLAIRAWMRGHGTARVERVITLGTPHAGTRLARMTRTVNGRQMAWQSDWLQTLAASETPASRELMRIAITPHDNIVYPQREQVLDGVPVTVFDGLGHLQLCHHHTVIAWVREELAAASSG